MAPLHWACVLLSLPHDNAETSNTFSNLRVGVLYGFLPGVVSDNFPFALLLVSNYPSRWRDFANTSAVSLRP